MIVAQAPAKVNLWLRVLGLRPDGYHEIETLMVPLDFGDEVRVGRASRAGIRLVCSGDCEGVPAGEENLAWRAGALFLEESGVDGGLEIGLVKRVPSGAGLGGGSSDAATVLLALNNLFGNPLDSSALLRLAARLGSDVPFFLSGGPAICRGRGEKVEPVSAEEWPLVLLKPPFGVSTAWAYRNFAKSPQPRPEEPIRGGLSLANSLEAPVFAKFLLLAVMKDWLLGREGVRGALLSGSGSTLFAVVESEGAGQALRADARREFGDELWTRFTRISCGTAKC